jgi:hypothetical protein
MAIESDSPPFQPFTFTAVCSLMYGPNRGPATYALVRLRLASVHQAESRCRNYVKPFQQGAPMQMKVKSYRLAIMLSSFRCFYRGKH